MSAPRYTLVTGSFFILYPDLPGQGPQPDGDTVSFLPDDDARIGRLRRFSGVGPKRKHLGTYSVRFEGIDALETHYAGHHQRLSLAHAARDAMLAHLGFGHVEFLPARPELVASAEHHPVRGYLLANGIESNGRVLGLVYAGVPRAGEEDGARLFVDAARLDASVNALLLAAGLAYAEPYHTMPLALIRRLRALVRAARTAGAGLWPAESVTTEQAQAPRAVTDLDDLVVFPKLYRRLVAWFATGAAGLAGFDDWVRADPVGRDDRALLPTGEMGNLHDLYEVTVDAAGEASIRLRYRPEDLIFDPDPSPAPVPPPVPE